MTENKTENTETRNSKLPAEKYGSSITRPHQTAVFLGIFILFFYLTYSRWTSSLPFCLWSQRIFPSLPGSRLPIFYRDASSALLQLVNQWLNFTYSRSHAPLRKKEHKSYFGKNRTHDFRTSRCAGYLLDHSGDEWLNLMLSTLASAGSSAESQTPGER